MLTARGGFGMEFFAIPNPLNRDFLFLARSKNTRVFEIRGMRIGDSGSRKILGKRFLKNPKSRDGDWRF